jgi:hypothetical protein
MHDLIVLKLLFILVIGAASFMLSRFADKEVRKSPEWWAGNLVSVLTGILAINEIAHLVNVLRGGAL